jgi:hypothetical protein
MRRTIAGLALILALTACSKTVVVQGPPSVSPECREWQIQWDALQDLNALIDDPDTRGQMVNEFYRQHPRPTGCEVPEWDGKW